MKNLSTENTQRPRRLRNQQSPTQKFVTGSLGGKRSGVWLSDVTLSGDKHEITSEIHELMINWTKLQRLVAKCVAKETDETKSFHSHVFLPNWDEVKWNREPTHAPKRRRSSDIYLFDKMSNKTKRQQKNMCTAKTLKSDHDKRRLAFYLIPNRDVLRYWPAVPQCWNGEPRVILPDFSRINLNLTHKKRISQSNSL